LEILTLLVVGIIVGILAGLLGVGGGTIIVPILTWILSVHQDITQAHLMHIAIGTSLATIVITAISSIVAHQQHKAIRWDIVKQLTTGIIIGALLGAIIADRVSTDSLRIIFGIFIIFVSIQMSIGIQPKPHHQLPNWFGMNIMGILIGSLSGLVGIGGGLLTVPFLTWSNLSIRHAIATSAACGLPIAIAGTMGFIITGWQDTNFAIGQVGYVYLPAFLTIAVASVLFAPLGAKLTHTLPVTLLKRIFAFLLAGVGIKMLFY